MRIAFVNTDMNIGGIPKASIPLLKELVKSNEVTLILTNAEGEVVNEVPKEVKIEVLESPSFLTQIKKAIWDLRFLSVVKSLKGYKKACNWIESLSSRIKLRSRLPESYDLAIAYFGMNAKCVLVTLEQVKAKKKVAWMHGDHPFKDGELPTMDGLYSRFDKIFCVSQYTSTRYKADFPRCKSKFDVFYNIMDVEDIRCKACLYNPGYDAGLINLLTIGRLSPEKGQMMIPDIAKMLKSTGVAFCWYIVGDGNDRESLVTAIGEEGLNDSIIVVGNKKNPYPYIKGCDIYVQPSFTEGYCLTILEAAILGRPIVATKVGGTWEHFEDGEDIMLANPDPKSISDKIRTLLLNRELRERMGENVVKKDWSNIAELNKFEGI